MVDRSASGTFRASHGRSLRLRAVAAAAGLALLGGCGDDGGGGETSSATPTLPERIGTAQRIDAWDGLAKNNPPDTPMASDLAVDDLGASSRLAQEMEFLGYTDTRDWQGGYYYDAAPASGRPGRVMVIIAAAGKTPGDKLVDRLSSSEASTGTAFGGTYACYAGSCMWGDEDYLIDVLAGGLRPEDIRTLIGQIRTGAPT